MQHWRDHPPPTYAGMDDNLPSDPIMDVELANKTQMGIDDAVSERSGLIHAPSSHVSKIGSGMARVGAITASFGPRLIATLCFIITATAVARYLSSLPNSSAPLASVSPTGSPSSLS